MKDKVAIVTGGGRGIGKAIALRLAREGAEISLAARSKDQMDEVALEIRALGRKAIVTCTDVSQVQQVNSMVMRTFEEFGRIDILVNNAGARAPATYLHNITPEEWDETVDVNLKGTFLCCKAVVPIMIKQGGGKIINIASMAGKKPTPMKTAYATSKMGIIGLTRSLASELGKFNINVNSICPGAVAGNRINAVISSRSKAENMSEDDIRKRYVSASPLERLVTAEDVAELVVFLASDSAKNMTGQDINITAGAVMY